jgi:DNA adenine methylase
MIEPFLKWPGGKRWLVSQHANFLPVRYERYIEPFLGGGAVFFRVAPSSSILSDANVELINAYRCIRRDPLGLDQVLAKFQRKHSDEFYYRMRATKPTEPMARAARFVYLNRTCFNGMYRVNREGQFNVPIGTKQAISYPPGYLEQVARHLRGANLRAMDFEETLDLAKEGDFVFVDPPYTVMHNNNGFIKYNAKLFSWNDQMRLASAVKRAARRGASILLSNADHSDVRTLYDGFGEHHQIGRSSVLSGMAEGRRSTTELLIRFRNN